MTRRDRIFIKKIIQICVSGILFANFMLPANAISVLQPNNKNCADRQYRDKNPTKCAFFGTAVPVFGGASILGGTLALISMASSSGSGGSSNTAPPVMPTMSTTYYNMVGNDIDAMQLASATSHHEYRINQNQYDDIRLGYSLARGYTGAGTTIAVLDSGTEYWHGAAVAAIAGGAIAPDVIIESHKVADSKNNFITYHEIGDVIASAQNANVYNASWSVPMRATEIRSRAELIANTDEIFITQISVAATERDAIFVWAAGNDGSSQSSALSVMPRVMPEMRGHFVNVVAFDSETQELAYYSNACGITKDYCITAPGSNIDTGTRIVNGTSFSTPIVSAAIAVLRQAYPYMTASQVTNLLFETARDLGAPGVDEVYGHGMLDLERATRPVGAALVPIGDNMQPLQPARVATPIAHAIKSANIQFAYFDAYGRPFQTQLANHIQPVPISRAFEFIRARDTDDKKMEFGPFEMGFSKKEFLVGDGIMKLQKNSVTGFTGIRGNMQLGQFNFFHRIRLSILHPRTIDESMIADISNAYIANIKTGVQFQNLTLSVAMPDTIVHGDINIRTPIARDNTGRILYTDNYIDISGRPALEYAVTYHFLTAAFIDNPYGEDEFFVAAKGSINF